MEIKIDGAAILQLFKGELNYQDISNQLMIEPATLKSISIDYINFILIKITNISYKHYLELGDIVLNKKDIKKNIQSIHLNSLKENSFFLEDAKKLDQLINQSVAGDMLQAIAQEHQLSAEKIT
ncbi:MAG: hypothetical protein FGM54_12045, partial [Chitinophagaceae bacterium]|nr:hypothetical protein [Chitinophagaceae bacterium]